MNNPNHPKPGSKIRVDPIRNKNSIRVIKKMLEGNPLHFAIFVFGINTGLRASELLTIKQSQIQHICPGDEMVIWQPKTKKNRIITINRSAHGAVQKLISERGDRNFIFSGQKGDFPLKVPTLNRMVKKWCNIVNLPGNYGSHSLRKTWGYWQRVESKTSLPLLMEAFGHTTQKQTLQYIGIQDEEIQNVYKGLEL